MKSINFHSGLSSSWNEMYDNDSFKGRIGLFNRLIEFNNLAPGKVIYDIGCGSGILLKESYYHISHNYVCFDGSIQMLREAELNFRESNNLVFNQVVINEETDWDFLANTAVGFPDVIVASSLVEYLDSYEYFIDSMLNILNNDGIFVFTIPNANSLFRRLQKVFRFIFKCFGVEVFSYLEISKVELNRKEIMKLVEKYQNIKVECNLPKSFFNFLGIRIKVSSLYYIVIKK
jgi:SAM-dependent methyltransferase